MYFLPTKLLKVSVTEVTPLAYWNDSSDPTDPWIGYPYQFTVKADITAQTHSNANTSIPFYYTGTDIKVGDWIADGQYGVACRVVSITTTDGSSITMVVEDVDRFNTANDPFQSGSAGINFGDAYVFSLDAQGMPNLMGVTPGLMASTFVTDLYARFSAFNATKRLISVNQPSHGLVLGDIIFLDDDGKYKRVSATQTNKDKLDRVIGSVTSVSIPGPDFFEYKPKGNYTTDISPVLPTAPSGSLIYIDPANPGKLTATKPTLFAVPVYIRITDTVGIYLTGGAGGSSAGPLGYNVTGYVVTTIAARDALDKTLINTGDTVFVQNNGSNKWELYEATAVTTSPAAVTWTKISSQTVSEFDPTTIDKSKIVNDDASTFVNTKATADTVTIGSKTNTVLTVSGNTAVTTGEKLAVTQTTGELQLTAKSTTTTDKVDVRITPQASGHVYFGLLGDGIVESEDSFDLTVRGGASNSTDAPGNLTLTGGVAKTANHNGGDVILTGGAGFGTGTFGTVKAVDGYGTSIVEFLSGGSSSANWITVKNSASNADVAINGVKIAVAAASASASVDMYLDPKGSGMVRVADYATYMSALNAAGGLDALVTKGYIQGITGGGDAPTLTAGVGLTDDAGTININVAATTIGVDGSNNLIVKSSATAGQVLLSTGNAGEQATFGALNLSSSASFTGVLSAVNGGLGFATYTAGDLLVGNAGGTLDKLGIGTTGMALFSTGTGLTYNYVGKLSDSNGLNVLTTRTVTTPANNAYVSGAATGGLIEFGAEGSDADIGLLLSTQGAGLIQAKTGYTANIAANRETIVTKGYVDDTIASGGDSGIRKSVINANWTSEMNVGTLTPVLTGKNVYVYRAMINTLGPITGGGVTQARIMSGANVVMDLYENDILTVGSYVCDLTESFTSTSTQLTIQFFGMDGTTAATPTGGAIEASVYYRIR